MSKFTEANRAKVLSTFNRVIEEDKDKYHAFHDIYHVLKDSCDCRVPDSKILPEREDLLHFLQKKMMDYEVHGLVHERLIKMVENLPAADTIPPAIAICFVFSTTPKIIMSSFMAIIMSWDQRCLKLLKKP
jgi:hypothetical protein